MWRLALASVLMKFCSGSTTAVGTQVSDDGGFAAPTATSLSEDGDDWLSWIFSWIVFCFEIAVFVAIWYQAYKFVTERISISDPPSDLDSQEHQHNPDATASDSAQEERGQTSSDLDSQEHQHSPDATAKDSAQDEQDTEDDLQNLNVLVLKWKENAHQSFLYLLEMMPGIALARLGGIVLLGVVVMRLTIFSSIMSVLVFLGAVTGVCAGLATVFSPDTYGILCYVPWGGQWRCTKKGKTFIFGLGMMLGAATFAEGYCLIDECSLGWVAAIMDAVVWVRAHVTAVGGTSEWRADAELTMTITMYIVFSWFTVGIVILLCPCFPRSCVATCGISYMCSACLCYPVGPELVVSSQSFRDWYGNNRWREWFPRVHARSPQHADVSTTDISAPLLHVM